MPLDKTDDMGDWIKDFQKSDAPQFKGKSQEKRRQMAIAAKLATENNALREANITIFEKRAFILAAKQAFLDGKKTFMFKEKEYKCTVKEEQDLFSELTDYLIAKKEDVDTATMADVDDGADAPGDIDPEDLESARDHAAQRFKKFNSEQSGDDDLPPHTDIQEAESNFRGLSKKLANDHMKFHTVGKPVVAYVQNTEQGNTAIGDIYFYTDGKNVIIASGNRQDGFGQNVSQEDRIIDFEPLKGNLKKFAQDWVRYKGRDYDIKLKKISNKARIFSNRGADNNMAPRGMPTTRVKTSDDYREAVEYHDRESMPSAVDDAANVMSKLDVYANFIKKTY